MDPTNESSTEASTDVDPRQQGTAAANTDERAATGQCSVAVNIAIFLVVAAIAQALAFPLSSYQRADRIGTERLRVSRLAQSWCGSLEELAREGRSAVAQLEGFVHGTNATHSPPYFDWNDWPVVYKSKVDTLASVQNATWVSRMSPRWDDPMSKLAARYPNIRVAHIDPLGFVANWFPLATQSSFVGNDGRVFVDGCSQPDNRTLWVVGGAVVSGVIDTSIIFQKTLYYRRACDDDYLLQRRIELNVTTPLVPRVCNVSRCWWGFVRCSMSLNGISASIQLNESAANHSMMYTVTAQGGWVPFLPSNRSTDVGLLRVINVSKFFKVSCDFAGLTLHVSSPFLDAVHANPGRVFEPEAITWTVVGSILGALFVVVAVNFVAALCFWARDPIRYAPRQAPIAIVAAEIALHGDLWDEAPVAAASVLASVAEMVHEQAKEHEAYVAGSTGHGYLIVADRPDKALHFMREFNAELSRAVFQSEEEPSKAGKRRSQGGKQLVLAHAKMVAHFGDDVSIAVNVVSKTAAYGGADVTLTRALLASVPPDADMYVTGALSEIVKMAAAVPSASTRSRELADAVDAGTEWRVDTRFGSRALQQFRSSHSRRTTIPGSNSRSNVSDNSSSPANGGGTNGVTGVKFAPVVATDASAQPPADALPPRSGAATGPGKPHADSAAFPDSSTEQLIVHRVCDEDTSTALKTILRDSLIAEPPAVQRSYAALVTCAEYFHEAIVMVLSPFRSAEAEAVTSRLRLTFGLPLGATQVQFHQQLAARTTVLYMRRFLTKSGPAPAPTKRGRRGKSSENHRDGPVEAATSNPLSGADREEM